MSNLRTLHFYATPEHDCSYLENKIAKTLFVDPQVELDQSTYSQLSDLGFRRSGKHVYRPHCDDCRACISVRIPLAVYSFSKSQKRILAKNKDIYATTHAPSFTEEYYSLYSRYINKRHQDGDMFPPSSEQFTSFLVEGAEHTQFIEFRDATDTLVAVSVIDTLEKGLSAIYTFFDPSLPKRSLGTFCILWQLQFCQQNNLNYLYLGYWVKNCRKMSYKISFRPFELLLEDQWVLVQPD
ncbi:arginyltransferase [Neptuniibacter marinus]|uniref:arginyltransferase n=1 Tax=Neptuniibacter marinus TaxID=1806670 RepID=UPI00082B105F|nr:arginyltransferase [Neptuniibacter marinus]